MKYLSLLFALLVFNPLFSNNKPAYLIYDKKGHVIKYSKLVKKLSKAEIILFGELHNNPVCHWLQLEITTDLFNADSALILGAEMFERDQQLLLNEVTTGTISLNSFNEQVRQWPNYPTDYQPLVDFAIQHQLRFLATNVPRRYAALVHHRGIAALDSISPEAKLLMAPLPFKFNADLPSYHAMLNMGHNPSPNLPLAQALKDATMAHTLVQNLSPHYKIIHYHGTYHSNHHEGIAWYIRYYQPQLNYVTIATVEQNTMDQLDEEYLDLADFIIVIPANMTKTY